VQGKKNVIERFREDQELYDKFRNQCKQMLGLNDE